jgi:hypothetical protein
VGTVLASRVVTPSNGLGEIGAGLLILAFVAGFTAWAVWSEGGWAGYRNRIRESSSSLDAWRYKGFLVVMGFFALLAVWTMCVGIVHLFS